MRHEKYEIVRGRGAAQRARDGPGGTEHREIGGGETASHMLSFKPPRGSYPSIDEKVRYYARILRDAAQHVDPSATSTPGAAFQVVEDDLPLVYRDTNTTRAGITALNNVSRGQTVGLVGLGGTGSFSTRSLKIGRDLGRRRARLLSSGFTSERTLYLRTSE